MLAETRRTGRVRLPVSADFVAMWAAALIGAGVLRNAGGADFERFIGDVSPIVVVAVAGAVGSSALRVLDSAGWVGSDPTRKGLARSTVLALGLGAAIIVADSALGFSEGINVSWPSSILFYPVMAFIAEVAFHLVPLALVVIASKRWVQRRPRAISGVGPIVAVALFEAVYQVVGSSGVATSPWLLGYLAFHMMAFAVAGLIALRRYGFGAMMWLRLVYYAIWHVAWGVLRLDLLF